MKTKLLKKVRNSYRIIYDNKQNVFWLKKGKRVLTVKNTKNDCITQIQKDVKNTYLCNNHFLSYVQNKKKNSRRTAKV